MGYNLPPGVEEHHLPGSRPEDAEIENASAELAEELKEVIDHYRAQYPAMGDEVVKDALLDLIPSMTGVVAKWQIEAAVQKHIELELKWANECARSNDKELYSAAQKTIRSRLLGIQMLVKKLVYVSGDIEEMIEEARNKVGNISWQGPAA